MIQKKFYRVISADREVLVQTADKDLAKLTMPPGGHVFEVEVVIKWTEKVTVTLEIETEWL